MAPDRGLERTEGKIVTKNTFCVVALLLTSNVAAGSENRTWTDSSGRFTVSAALLEIQGGEVVLKKTDDNSRICLPLPRLSANDLDWLKKNTRPRTLILPPVQVDMKTLDTNESQRVDLRAALGGLEDFSVVGIAINGEQVSPLRGQSIHQSGDSVEFELQGSPGATIELQRGGGEQSKTLLVRPRLVLQPNGARVPFSVKSLAAIQTTLTQHIATTRRELKETELVLANLPSEIAAAQRRLQNDRTDREKLGWINQIAKQQKILKAAQTKVEPLQKRLASLPAHERHATAALKWLEEVDDRVLLTFRVETTVANDWRVPVACMWEAQDQTTLGVLADVAAECWQLPHRWRNERRVGERELKAVVDQLESKIANRQTMIRFKITDLAADPHGKHVFSVAPVEQLAGVAYPPTIARSFAGDGVAPRIGDVITVSGTATLSHQRPAATPMPFRRIGEQAGTPPHASASLPEPATVTLRFDVPNGSEDVLHLWLHVASSVKQGTPRI